MKSTRLQLKETSIYTRSSQLPTCAHTTAPQTRTLFKSLKSPPMNSLVVLTMTFFSFSLPRRLVSGAALWSMGAILIKRIEIAGNSFILDLGEAGEM